LHVVPGLSEQVRQQMACRIIIQIKPHSRLIRAISCGGNNRGLPRNL
jgi:hypothetical protein